METTQFDYVIVGGGSAGAVMAARLTEDPAVTVALLEAGPAPQADAIRIPLAFSTLFKTHWDWNYSTTAQPALNHRQAYWPRMRALGGCSAMNAMIYIRGNRADFDSWRDDYGATGWGYADVLPYFRRSENNQRWGGPYHGQDGEQWVEDRRYTHPLSKAFVASAVEYGLTENPDFNGAEQWGAGQYQVTCRKGRRWSTYDGFIQPVATRPNLLIVTQALATQVVFDGTVATGVRYFLAGASYVVKAKKEVILAAGAINSPQLLLLSGVGPGEQLAAHNISPVAELPGVGANLQDHPAVPLIWHTRNTSDIAQFSTPAQLLRWSVTGRGPLASNVGESGAFFATAPGLQAPDMQIITAPTGFYDNGLHEPTSAMMTIAPILVSVASRGSLTLASANPRHRPIIDPAYYRDPADMEAMVAGVRQTLELAQYGPLASALAEPWQLPLDPSDAQLRAHIRRWTQTLYHPTSTCAMGTGEMAVVDPWLRVHNVSNLRVVDASVMPAVPRGNTNAPTIMIAEKAAALLKETHDHR